jgi:hypothetical protein
MRLAPALAGLDPEPAQLDEPLTRPLERYSGHLADLRSAPLRAYTRKQPKQPS